MKLADLRGWNLRHGSWWMVQWQIDGWVSLGIHIDLRRRYTGRTKQPYGPYVDFHLLFIIVSFGYKPLYSGEYDSSMSGGRGGHRAEAA